MTPVPTAPPWAPSDTTVTMLGAIVAAALATLDSPKEPASIGGAVTTVCDWELVRLESVTWAPITPPTIPDTIPTANTAATARPLPLFRDFSETLGGVYNHDGSVLMALYLSQFLIAHRKKI